MKKYILIILLLFIVIANIVNYNYKNRFSVNDSGRIVSLYTTLIDHIMSESPSLNDDAEYLALDIDSFLDPIFNGSDTEKTKTANRIVKYAEKFNLEILVSTYEELKNNNLVDADGNLLGPLITVESIKKFTNNKAKITANKYRYSLGAVGFEYKLSYIKGEWNIKIRASMIS